MTFMNTIYICIYIYILCMYYNNDIIVYMICIYIYTYNIYIHTYIHTYMCVLIWMHPWVIKVVQLWQGVAFDHLQDLNCLENRLERWSWGNFAGGVLPSLHSERPSLCYKYVTNLAAFCGLVILKTFPGPSLLNQDLIPKQAPCADSQSTVYWTDLDSDSVSWNFLYLDSWERKSAHERLQWFSKAKYPGPWWYWLSRWRSGLRALNSGRTLDQYMRRVVQNEKGQCKVKSVGERADPEDNFLEAVVSGSWWHS